MVWQPALGAWPEGEGVRFRVWAPEADILEVVPEKSGGGKTTLALANAADGCFSGFLPGFQAGDRYRFRPDGQGPFPDPASRFQPEGVHGPSEVIDPGNFSWSDAVWTGVELENLIIYELHVGTFTPQGTFAGVQERLPYLADLGVTAIELMPLADFPGRWNWGYDGVDLFAPARCYGRPDDLRRLVDSAHRLGLGVLLDVVYNHLGPDGNYLGVFSPWYFSKRHQTAWGAAVNFDGPHNDQVRAFFCENALHWLHEYHVDGFRLDATHAIRDDSPRPFLAEMTAKIHAAVDRPVLVIAEDHRNLACLVKPDGGWGLDAVWADDFHHQTRRLLAGDHESYFRDFTGSTDDLAATIREGWFYHGQHSAHLDQLRGTDSAGVLPRQLVYCLQNHDQVGNRALGERLHHQVEGAAYRAATVLLLCVPATPLLFMGQEWAAGTPFLFFTDHHEELGRLVTEGRRREFRHFSAFTDPQVRERIPDPQAQTTFQMSQLNWDETVKKPHAAMRRFYQALLHLRRNEPALRPAEPDAVDVFAGADAIILNRTPPTGPALLIAIQLRGPGCVDLSGHGPEWLPILSTEDTEFCTDPRPPHLDLTGMAPKIHFARPGAVIMRESPGK